MAKSSSVFVCQSCNAEFPKWQGKCDSCGEWNTLVEQVAEKRVSGKGGLGRAVSSGVSSDQVISFSQVKLHQKDQQRLSTGFSEMDRVLGGGIVPGAVMLIGGEPGIGKSTLLTQVVFNVLIAAKQNLKIVYVAGEESPNQIGLRINRLLKKEYKNNGDNLWFYTSSRVDEIVTSLKKDKPDLVIVDSVQTLTTDDLTGAAGSVGQLREVTDRLTDVAKAYHIPIFLVGHVTKEGQIAGPKILEHIVDAVLELSGERSDELRILRAIKNRFGATDEVGVFRVVEEGLAEVSNPSQLFLAERNSEAAGSATICVVEGTRPLMIEVQALVVSSQLAMPRRVGRGIELSRIQVLAAILQKHCYLPLGSMDVFVSAAGGLKLKEPAADLGLAVAIASSLKGAALPPKTLFIGEVGLLGEIRSVNHLERRLKEAKRLGFENVISRKTHTTVQSVMKSLKLT